MYAAYGILGALYERERSGRGRRVEVNMLEAAVAFIPDPFANYTRAGIMSDRLTRVAASQSFAFRCGDGKLLAVHLSSQPKFFEAIAAALERPDLLRDERFTTRDLRIKNFGDLTRILGEIVGNKVALALDAGAGGERRAVRPGATICRTCSTIRRCAISVRSTSKPIRPKARSPPSIVRC